MVYVLDKQGNPLMPTSRYGKVRRLLKEKKAVAVSTKPFTIRLKYEPETKITQPVVLGMDPGRTNIGLAGVREDGTCLYQAKCQTRNKEIPKLMAARRQHRQASRRGERLARKRLAKRLGTTLKKLLRRKLPGYGDGVMEVKDIINTEARFLNRLRSEKWLTPTATQLLRTHLNLFHLAQKILPIHAMVLEVNRFAFMALDNPDIQKLDYQKGPLKGYGSVEAAVSAQQNGTCLLCKHEIEEYHHIVPRSRHGSNTIGNLAGLCRKCHEKVHKDVRCQEKLTKKKEGLNKKYGALSVLNQIIPFLAAELAKEIPLTVTEGYITKQFREAHGITKDHDLDAYCIACSALSDARVALSDTCYEIKQYRNHDRARINSQTERTYRLNGKIVAKNRRKRMDQKTPSIHEFYLEQKAKYGKKEAKRIMGQLKVQKSMRRYNDMARILAGAEVLYKGKRYVKQAQLSNGQYLRFAGKGDENYPEKQCSYLRKTAGLKYI